MRERGAAVEQRRNVMLVALFRPVAVRPSTLPVHTQLLAPSTLLSLVSPPLPPAPTTNATQPPSQPGHRHDARPTRGDQDKPSPSPPPDAKPTWMTPVMRFSTCEAIVRTAATSFLLPKKLSIFIVRPSLETDISRRACLNVRVSTFLFSVLVTVTLRMDCVSHVLVLVAAATDAAGGGGGGGGALLPAARSPALFPLSPISQLLTHLRDFTVTSMFSGMTTFLTVEMVLMVM